MFEARTGSLDGNVKVNITSPSRQHFPHEINNLHNGIYHVTYKPSEVGTYSIDVQYETIPTPGSPFVSKSCDTRTISICSIAPGVVGQPSEFTSANGLRAAKMVWNDVMTGIVSPNIITREIPLDLVFTIDFTGSMKPHIKKAMEIINGIVTDIKDQEHVLDFRLALVKYRDHDHNYITKVTRFTKDDQKILNALYYLRTFAQPQDYAEAVEDALYFTEKLDWRPEAKKICVLIGDAPAHGLITGSIQEDRFQKEGCPLMRDAMVITNNMAKRGITLYVIGCGKAAADYRDWFSALAHITGGQFMSLASANNLNKVLSAGIKEDLALIDTEKVLRSEMQRAYSLPERIADESAFVRRIHQMLKEEGIRTVRVRYNGGKAPEPSECAKQLANCRTMSEARRVFRTNEVRAKDVNIELVDVDISESRVERMFNKILKSMELCNWSPSLHKATFTVSASAHGSNKGAITNAHKAGNADTNYDGMATTENFKYLQLVFVFLAVAALMIW